MEKVDQGPQHCRNTVTGTGAVVSSCDRGECDSSENSCWNISPHESVAQAELPQSLIKQVFQLRCHVPILVNVHTQRHLHSRSKSRSRGRQLESCMQGI